MTIAPQLPILPNSNQSCHIWPNIDFSSTTWRSQQLTQKKLKPQDLQKQITTIPFWKEANEKFLACIRGILHNKPQHNIWPICLFLIQTSKKRICLELLWETHRTSAEMQPGVRGSNTNTWYFHIEYVGFRKQKQFLKETMSPTKALKIDIHMEMGAQNQQNINQNLNTNA